MDSIESAFNNEFIESHVKPPCEADISKFWPIFSTRFRYVSWVGSVLPKIKTEKEFCSAVTFQSQRSGVMYVIPGKVSNIFDVEREVKALIKKENILSADNYLYVKNGTLHEALSEIKEKPRQKARNTCELQLYLNQILSLPSPDQKEKLQKIITAPHPDSIKLIKNRAQPYKKISFLMRQLVFLQKLPNQNQLNHVR